MKIYRKHLFSFAAIGLVIPTFASADVVNVDLGRPTQADDGEVYIGIAAAADAGGADAVWNASTGTSTDLLDSHGHSTSVGVEVATATAFFNDCDQELVAVENLLGDYLAYRDESGTEIKTSRINGLVPGNSYDLYFYGQGDNFTGDDINGGQNTGFRIGSEVRHTSYDGVPGGDGRLIEDVEYVMFSDVVADSTGSIVFEHFGPGVGISDPTDPEFDGNSTVNNSLFFDSDSGSVDLDDNGSRYHTINAIQIVGNFSESTLPPKTDSSNFLGLLGMLGVPCLLGVSGFTIFSLVRKK